MQNHNLEIPLLFWFKLIKELRRRGKNINESGAFLLAKQNTYKITHFICYDDLDPKAIERGYIYFSSEGYIPLWNYCEMFNMVVLADVHTHPGLNTKQSTADKEHPMVAQKGHISLIVPSFAINRFQTLSGVGIYEYLGDCKWKTWQKESKKVKISIL